MFLCATESHNNGFTMTFENGYTVSVRWGWANYCHNRTLTATASTKNVLHSGAPSSMYRDSATAEVAVWDKNGDFVSSPGVRGDVETYQSTEDVAALLSRVSAWNNH
jgi:hypothetical protein